MKVILYVGLSIAVLTGIAENCINEGFNERIRNDAEVDVAVGLGIIKSAGYVNAAAKAAAGPGGSITSLR